MPLQGIFPAKFTPGNVPETESIQYVTAQAFLVGAALVLSAGQVTEATSPIATAILYGFALEAPATKPGWNAANSPTVITGRVQEVSIARANAQTTFGSALVNNSAVAIAPVQADIGASYGLKSYSNIWVVDKSITGGNATVVITDIDTDQNLVFWKPIAARLASN